MMDADGTPPATGQDNSGQAAAPSSRSASFVLVLRAYRTEYAIYGTVLVSALIAVGWKYDTDLDVLLFVVGTIGVFWLAHIYSGVIASEQTDGPRAKALWRAALHSARQSVGLVLAMLVPALFLVLATIGLIDEYVAYYLALWVGVLILAILGWENSSRRGSRWSLCLLSAAVTSALGLGVIWLSTLVH